MENLIAILTVVFIVAAAAIYLIRSKKKGAACLGCSCNRQCRGSCHSQTKL